MAIPVPHRQRDTTEDARAFLDFSHHTKVNTTTATSHAANAARESVMRTAPMPNSTTTYHMSLCRGRSAVTASARPKGASTTSMTSI